MTNGVEANWSGSTLLAKVGHIRVKLYVYNPQMLYSYPDDATIKCFHVFFPS